MIRDWDATQEDVSNVQDLFKEPILVWQRNHYLALLLLMNVGVPVLIGLLHGDIWGSFLLAGFLRLTLSQHFTYLINSAAHMWGTRQYDPRRPHVITASFPYSPSGRDTITTTTPSRGITATASSGTTGTPPSG